MTLVGPAAGALALACVVAADDTPLFVDVTAGWGLHFRYETGHPNEDYFLPALMGGGAAVFDADGDGRLDVLFVNGHAEAGSLRLFRQRDDGFRETTGASALRLPARVHGMGCAVADVDNDGDDDVYVTCYGRDRLFKNDGNGVFVDATDDSGAINDGWGASAAFLDFDRDGWLDLYVTNYMDLDEDQVCRDEAGRQDFCGPDFPGQPDKLFRNRGDGTYEDVSVASGIAKASHAGLGVVCADFDDDGWIDIYVANDKDPNLLWINTGNGSFDDDGAMLGVAYSGHGRAEAGMGVTTADPDEDGDLDIFVTHLATETNTFYQNDDGFAFDDRTGAAGLAASSIPYTGWGTAFFDADLDGDLDIAVVNGAVQRRAKALRSDGTFWSDYAEPNLLYRNTGAGRYEVHDGGGAFVAHVAVSRAAIPVDIDRDGDQDLLVTNIDGTARLYLNQASAQRWLAIDTFDPDLGRAALGARLEIRVGDTTFLRHALPPGGYLSAAPSTIHLGLPNEGDVRIDVRWPDGREEKFESIEPGRIVLRPGGGVERR